MPEKPSRAPVFLLQRQGPLGRLQGAELSTGSLFRSRRVLHLSLITLVAVGALLFAALGPVGAGSSPDRTRLALNDGLHSHVGRASAVAGAVAITPTPESVPVTLHEDGLATSTTAAAPTVGEALAQKGIVLGRGAVDVIVQGVGEGQAGAVRRRACAYWAQDGEQQRPHRHQRNEGEMEDAAGGKEGACREFGAL